MLEIAKATKENSKEANKNIEGLKDLVNELIKKKDDGDEKIGKHTLFDSVLILKIFSKIFIDLNLFPNLFIFGNFVLICYKADFRNEYYLE